MKYANVYYVNEIKKVSGITTFLIEIAKKYKDKDILIVYKTKADIQQLNILKKYVRVIKESDQVINCKNLYITHYTRNTKNFNSDSIIGVVHTDYKINNLPPYKDVDKVIAVSNKVATTYEEISGVKPIVCHNPLTMEKQPKLLRLIYIGRLTIEKGKERIIKLLNKLDKNNIPYLLTIVSEETLGINNDNVSYLIPRPNVRLLIPNNDYLIQLSNDDESYSYSINEALSLGVPIIATKLSCLKELGINEKHGYLLDFDMNNIPVDDIYNKIPKVEYTPIQDNWENILVNDPSNYNGEETIEIRIIQGYTDIELEQYIVEDAILKVQEERAKHLVEIGIAEYEDVNKNKSSKYSVSIIIPVYNQEELILRTLDSIPTRNNIEIIIVDDKSTDNTIKNVKQYKKEHLNKNITIISNKENKGVGYTFNQGLNKAKNDYILRIDSDDYFYTKQLNYIIDNELDGTDMIYYNLKDNNGRTLDVDKNNRSWRCGAVKFIKREFLGDTRCPEIRTAEDKALNDTLLNKKPTEKFTNLTMYHYNYPREGSLYDLTRKGLL